TCCAVAHTRRTTAATIGIRSVIRDITCGVTSIVAGVTGIAVADPDSPGGITNRIGRLKSLVISRRIVSPSMPESRANGAKNGVVGPGNNARMGFRGRTGHYSQGEAEHGHHFHAFVHGEILSKV